MSKICANGISNILRAFCRYNLMGKGISQYIILINVISGLRVEERTPVWRVAVNILNKQSRTADKGWSSSLGVGRGSNNTSPWKHILLRNIHRQSLGRGLILRYGIRNGLQEVGWGDMDWVDTAVRNKERSTGSGMWGYGLGWYCGTA
jgi:hypothetical protein